MDFAANNASYNGSEVKDDGVLVIPRKIFVTMSHNHLQKKMRINQSLFRSSHIFTQAPTIYSSVHTVGELKPHPVGDPLRIIKWKLFIIRSFQCNLIFESKWFLVRWV